MKTPMMTRHDFPGPVKNVMIMCHECGILDIFDLYSMGSNYGQDFKGFLDELSTYVAVNGIEVRAQVVPYIDLAYKNIEKPEEKK